MLPEAPPRSLIQRQEALLAANTVRTFRKNLKRDLKAGRAFVNDYIQSPPQLIETMKVFDLLLATPKLGRVKVNQIMVRARISPAKTIGGLSDRQRTAVLSLLRRR